MPLFIKTTKGADGRIGESAETQNLNSYKFKLNVLENKHKDVFGNVTSQKFYEEWQGLIDEAIDGPLTSANIITLQNAMQTLNTEKANFDFGDTVKTGETGITTAREDLEDTWGNVWQNKTALSDGNFEGMFATMEGYILEQKTLLQEELNNLKAITDDTDMINGVESVIEFYDEQESMYRDVLISPSRFRLDVNSNDAGEVTDVKLNDIGANTQGYSYTSKDTDTGVKVFGRSNAGMTKDEEQRSVIGNTMFKKHSDNEDFEASDDLDFSSWRVQDPRNSRVGDILVGPNGKVLMKNEDGSYEKSSAYSAFGPNRTVDRVLGVPVQAANQYRVSQDMFDSIERTQPVDDVQKREMQNDKMKQTQGEIESHIRSGEGDLSQEFQTGGETTPQFLSTTPKAEPTPKEEKGGFASTVNRIFGGAFSKGGPFRRA